jgi:hypothetical protein
MNSQADRPDDDEDVSFEEEWPPEERLNVDGAYSDERSDPAMAPVIEAGGGVAEGFEQSEALLVDNATGSDLDATMHIVRDAGDAEEEAEPDRGVYGEADHERSSELDNED